MSEGYGDFEEELGASSADADDRAADAMHGAADASPPSGSASTGARWTKGPWKLGETLEPMGGCLSRGVFAPDTFIAEVLFDDEDDPTAEANAHLIAAAPELAEAVADLAEMFIAYGAAIEKPLSRAKTMEAAFDHFAGDSGCIDAWESALAALAKARGVSA